MQPSPIGEAISGVLFFPESHRLMMIYEYNKNQHSIHPDWPFFSGRFLCHIFGEENNCS